MKVIENKKELKKLVKDYKNISIDDIKKAEKGIPDHYTYGVAVINKNE
jgi:hypothetical protein